MPAFDRVMPAPSRKAPFAARRVVFKIRSLRAARTFGRKVDPVAQLARQHLDAVVSAFRDQEQRRLQGWMAYRWLRALAQVGR